MFTNCGFPFAVLNRSTCNVLRSLSFFSARAEEPTEPTPQVNYEDLIAKARKEEKDKLYPRIQKAESDLKEQVKINNELLLRNAALSEELEKVKSKSNAPDPRIAELEQENEALKGEIQTLKDSSPNEDEIRAKVEKEYEIKLYAQQKKDELKSSGKVLTMLLDTITGNTTEEIDSAVTAAIEKTKSVKADLGIEDDDPEGDPAPKKKAKAKKSTTKQTDPTPSRAPAANPSGEDDEEYDAEYIRNLDPRSKEYKEFRAKLGLR